MGKIHRVALCAVLAFALPSLSGCSSSSSTSTNCCSLNGACSCDGESDAGAGCTVKVTRQGTTCDIEETCVQATFTSTTMIHGGMPTTTCSGTSPDGG